MFWIEANPEVLPILQINLAGYVHQHIIRALVLDTELPSVPFHITNYDGMSSSVFEWGTHTSFAPDTIRVKTIDLPATTLDALDEIHNFNGCNMLNIDIEGAGLLALKGATHLLRQMDVLYLEIQTENVYDGAPLLGEVSTFLDEAGFELVDVGMVDGQGWGDCVCRDT